MTIDINQLTEAEWVDLNRRIIERLRLLTQMRAHMAMMEFKIGDRVFPFQATGDRLKTSGNSLFSELGSSIFTILV